MGDSNPCVRCVTNTEHSGGVDTGAYCGNMVNR